MTKYHINKRGVPSICQAKNDNCPLGGNQPHFRSSDEAQDYIDQKTKRNMESYLTMKEKSRN